MSARPDVGAALEAGEVLVWQGHPKPGRQVSLRANLLGAALYTATILIAFFAWWLEIYWGHVPHWRLAVYLLVSTAAFCTYLGLRLTLLDRRRARARDAQTAYAITNRRALALVGPYSAEVRLAKGVTARTRGDTLLIAGPETRLAFERVDDASKARDILLARIEDSA